jgi:putative CocE/NonD family hydrolase
VDGRLDERPPDAAPPASFALDPDDPVPTLGGAILLTAGYLRGPVEQSPRERRGDVLVFTSEPLDAPLVVMGRVRFEAWVEGGGDVVARLCDVHPDGRSFNVVDGILRTPSAALQEVQVDLWSTAHAFLPGHRLRLQVCASDFPRYDLNPGGGRLHHAPDRAPALVLPVAPA